jgi:enoyl-CoA hydratase
MSTVDQNRFCNNGNGLDFDIENAIAFVTINRPDKLNALNEDLLKNLKDLIKWLIQNKELKLKGLILQGSGDRSFIAGADIEELSKMDQKAAYNFSLLGQHVTLLLERLPFPVLALVQGFAFGGGMELAMACDFILASDKAQFALPELKLGLIPGFGGTQRLSRVVGKQKAKEIIFSGRMISAAEAYELGLVLKIVPQKEKEKEKETLKDEAIKLIESFKKSSPASIHCAKKVIGQGVDLSLVEALNLELEEFSNLFTTADQLEGTQAFLEKRAAQFSPSKWEKDEML